MKIDRSKLKKSTSDIPPDCQALIEKLTSTSSDKSEFLKVLQSIETWTYGKCELLHWVDVLDACDEVLEAAAKVDKPGTQKPWTVAVDTGDETMKDLVLWTLNFTTFLIEHSFSRHLYSSMEHLTTLLQSCDLDVVLAVLNLLYMFSKRSNFITRLGPEKRAGLLGRLTHLAASWGGRDNGFALSKCCTDAPIDTFPSSATSVNFEYYVEIKPSDNAVTTKPKGFMLQSINLERVDRSDVFGESASEVVEKLLESYQIPYDRQVQLFTYVRLARAFPDYNQRLKCVQARLQALSILIYSNQLTDNAQSLLYTGLLEELVEVLEMKGQHLMEIKAAALKALTAIIHLDRNPNFPKLSTIIDVTGASSYHGFLPVLVRNCIAVLTSPEACHTKNLANMFPQPLATALFSFLYHLASYEAGGEALVSCGMMESLLKVVQWPSSELDHITFVTRAVRVIDLITNLDMQSFQAYSGLTTFITRLALEVEHCRKQQPFQIPSESRRDSLDAIEQREAEEAARAAGDLPQDEESMEVDEPLPLSVSIPNTEQLLSSEDTLPINEGGAPDQSEEDIEKVPDYSAAKTGLTCLPQRAALLKSMLNFLKKAISDSGASDSIRHVMDGSLPESLKHIISNCEYYGPSLFLLATDVVTAYVFQEPSLLSSLQDNGLTDVVLRALLVKDVPATKEVLGSLPNVFSALCLNSRGLTSFVACKPFERLFKVLLSPDYLPAMRRRSRTGEANLDTASNLGNAMDELMRHQPSLRESATGAIIKLLEELCALGRDPKKVCWKAQIKPDAVPPPQTRQSSNNEGGSSDEEDEEDDEPSNGPSNQDQNMAIESHEPSPPAVSTSKEAVPLVDYINNVMKFVDSILSNNSTDDHCREFVSQKGLVPLMGILGLPNLPIDFPSHVACQAVASVSKSILNLAHEPQVLKQGLLHLNDVLKNLEPLHKPLDPPGGSVLLRELVSSSNLNEAVSNPQATPLLHSMAAAHSYIQMFIHVCRTSQADIRIMSVGHWGSELGLTVLRGLSKLYSSLVWESSVMLALINGSLIPKDCEFGKSDIEKLLPPDFFASKVENDPTLSPSSGTSGDSGVTAAMESLTTDSTGSAPMEVDEPTAAASKAKEKLASPAQQHQTKQLKPVLGCASRLGRSLAELFALLVKLCVGSPLRQRRGQQLAQPQLPPGPAASAVAGALSRLLTTCFTWEPPSTCPVSRFRITFFTCSVGFTTPMLFDEKKFPFHLMLYKFISLGGQNAFFDAFDWALESFKSEGQEIPETTGEFLDSWLQLLEKMVNPKTILESPHVLQTKMAQVNKQYEPMKYLARAHRMAFKVILKLWGKKPLKVYGGRMTESVLSIICHILRGEKLIASKQEKEKAKGETVPGPSRTMTISRFAFQPGSSLPVPPSLNPQPAREAENSEPEINQETLQILLDMGFPRERCVEAVEATNSLDQATDYLLRPQAVLLGNYGMGLVSGMGEQEDLARALAMSLGDNVMVSTDTSSEASEGRQKEEEEESILLKEEFEPLNKQVIDDFTNDALQGCLCLLDSLPNTVYRVCDLLISIFNRNGPEFKQATLNELMQEVQRSVDSLLTSESCESVEKYALHFTSSPEASKTAVRIHLFTLLFEECKMMCAGIVHKTQIMQSMTKLLTASCHTLLRLSDGSSLAKRPTPKWMTPMLLFIDLYEKVVLGIKRKLMLASICERKWKVFDVSTGKWSNYQEPNNKTIDDAYWAGESSVRVQFNRKKYMIQFATMMQVNEDTGNRRPVMISLAKNKADVAKPDSKDSITSAPQGMSEKDRCDLLKSCVALIKVPVDGDALNAVMRLSLRLTQDYELAVQFAELGGIKTLFELTHASSFSGFMSLAALLIRHVMEDKASLRYTIEKVIRSQTSGSGTTTTKELHHILRNLAPASCRATSIFSEVSREILRVDTSLWKRGEPEDDPRLLMHSLVPKNSPGAPPLPDVATSVIKDLLNFLILVYKDTQVKDGNVKSQQERKDLVGQLEANFPPGVNLFQEDSSSAPSPKSDVPKESADDPSATKPSKHLMTKAGVCKLLSELVKCYGNCAKVITEHVYMEGSSELIIEETTALAFMLDELLIGGSTPASQAAIDKDCPTLVKTLLTTITSCSHYGEAEMDVISEVKSALGRALALSEGSVKHSKIQALTNLICMMIENSSGGQVPTICAVALKNQVIKVMVKKGLVTDLARVPHSLDLSSPNVAQTINACLKPLEIMSRIINTPAPITMNRLGKPKPANESGLPTDGIVPQQGEGGTNTTNSEATRAQGDETIEPDCEATEHDISTAAESIDPISESQLQTAGDSTVDELDDVITQLIDTDSGGPHILEEVAVARQLLDDSSIFGEVSRLDSTMDETHDSQMLTQDQSAFENQQMSQDEEEDDSTDGSHSDATEENEDLEENGMEEDNEDEDEEEDEDDEDDGDEDDDDDDDDDDEEDDDDDDEGNSHFDDIVEESALRFPTITDPDSDDIEYLFYPEHNDVILEHLEDRGRRSLHLPMWSDVGADITMYDLGANGGAIVYNGNSNTNTGSNVVTSHHPMLMGRQGATDVATTHTRTATRSALQLIQRNRSFQRFVHVGRVGGPTGNLQNLIGAGNPHDLITHGLRRGTPLLVDVGYAILDGNEMDLQDTEQNSQIARAASLSAIPSSLCRWMEESRVIDGDSMHDCMTLIKPEILEVIEQNLEAELADRRAKKKKQDDEEAAKKLAADAVLKQKIEESTSEINRHLEMMGEGIPEMMREPIPEMGEDLDLLREGMPERGPVPAITQPAEQSQPEAELAVDAEIIVPRDFEEAVETICNALFQNPEQMDFSVSEDEWQSNLPSTTPPVVATETQTSQAIQEQRPDTSTSAPGDAHVLPSLEAEEPMYTADNDGSPEDLSLPARLGVLESFPPRMAETEPSEVVSIMIQGASASPANVLEPIAGPSGLSARGIGSGEDYSAILGIDIRDLPEGVDPSFLAALPEDMRLEVIEEQRRLQSIRQRAAQNTEAGVTEVNPEFLAALPPNIQEELLTQQRIELQRQAAAANPEAPVDAGEFLSTLPASLRQSVLADLEDSQLPSLPADIVAEAQTLRREFEQRNRAAIHDRYFAPGSAALSSILRTTVNRLGNHHHHQYVISSLRSAARDFRDDFWRANQAVLNTQSLIQSAVTKPTNHQGRFLLDNEALSCLLILLFIDDQKINTTRLHRILRNVCYHGPTRDWVVRSLLSILEKANEKADPDFEGACASDVAAVSSKGKKSSQPGVRPERNVPSWLNISLDAAIGSRANIFQVTKSHNTHKKANPSVHIEAKQGPGWTITIHPGAAVAVCRHTLEVLISLSKSFPMHFIPQDKPTTSGSKSLEASVGALNSDTGATPKSKQHVATSKKDFASDFWETLLRLDQQSKYSKKGKNVIRIQSYTSTKSEEGEEGGYTFESSPFGQLFIMLSNPVVNRSSVLTDKLLRLLSYISLGQSEMSKVQTVQNVAKQRGIPERFHDKTIQPKADHIQLVVQVLTSKSCSEEGLEDVTTLLLNLSHGPRSNREQILSLLLAGARELGNVVRQNILDLKHELQDLLLTTPTTSGTASNASPTDEEAESFENRQAKGSLIDRFTRESVVVTAPSKVKGGSELQLPSMSALTTKTSSQTFFLRLLKVIIQLRETVLLDIKAVRLAETVKDKEKNSKVIILSGGARIFSTGLSSSQSTSSPSTTGSAPTTTSDTDSNQAPSASASVPSSQPPKPTSDTNTTPVPMEIEDSAQAEDAREGSISPPLPDCLPSLSDELGLDSLWEALSDCLKDLAHTSDHHAVLVLQATVEAFFLVHAAPTMPDENRRVREKETRSDQLAHILEQPLPSLTVEKEDGSEDTRSSTPGPSANAAVELPPDTKKFLAFAETHRTVLNQILRQSTVHLADGPFSVLVDHTRVLDFDIKRRYFRTELDRMDENSRREDLAVHVRRDNVFEDSFRELHRRSPEEWKNRFYIVFEGEEGQDAGGLLREWYVIISKEIFNPMYALFKTSPGDKVTYMIYESSDTNPNHLDYFKFVGRVIAKAIYDNKHLECYFSRSFYKHILAKHVKYTDMESEDYAFYKGLEFLLEHKVEDLGYEPMFSVEIQEFGVTEVRDLIANGRNIRVTEANKLDYIRLVCQMKMTGAIRKQLTAFLEGFYSIIPRRLISIFNEQELELLLSGLPTIDIEDLKNNTEYHKYQPNSLQIVWFWRALRSFDMTDKAKFLQFVTGSSKVPLQGFATLEGMNGAQKFQIHRDDRSTDRLPSAHTCFNQLDLPAYETFDKLKSYLLKAIRECSEGFGFA